MVHTRTRTNQRTRTKYKMNAAAYANHINCKKWDIPSLVWINRQTWCHLQRSIIPKGDYVQCDVTDVNTFPREHATHAMCLYFTIYYIQNKRGFFQNVFHWLRPGGYFALHLVNRNMFDPILPPGNLLMFVNAQQFILLALII